MTGELILDTGGLNAGAARSEATAASLIGTTFTMSMNSQPSAGGVAAVNAALSAVQGRQSTRITGQAGDMTTGAAAYTKTDTDGSGAITAVSV
ncbi:hypothetical protein C1S82_18405 [Mycolicibacterium cosmeticum]|uniref:Uncharacterized protein n=1 Tax=Mycolicibacterium cosmeticum TaxID=258533 RepID=W9AQQ7_MYCCO|nr:hypothetical protein [Mycolicibacterium cosmeticum]TLH71749.1 hypothetical protein C1S82_18405 [Mycolicibacterium cosmeticum]CDO08069.1 hypothetical protein BN977_02888 [Mycolicibacterium cosmeticum]